MGATPLELTEANFEDTLKKGGILFIDFWAAWCGPCRAFAPTFESAAAKHPDIIFAKVDTEKEQGLAQAFEIARHPHAGHLPRRHHAGAERRRAAGRRLREGHRAGPRHRHGQGEGRSRRRAGQAGPAKGKADLLPARSGRVRPMRTLLAATLCFSSAALADFTLVNEAVTGGSTRTVTISVPAAIAS